jgi:hypothetical protein
MIVEKFASLPPWITYEGVVFELQLIIDGIPNDVRLCYCLSYTNANSKHYIEYKENDAWLNPFQNGARQGFLYLIEGIETDEDLIEAIDNCHEFLKKNNLK